MFDPDYVKGLDGTALDEDDTETVRDIAFRLGYVSEDDDYDDGGLTQTENALALMTAPQLRRLRAWLIYYGTEIAPGRARLEGGDEGIKYSDEDEQSQPELEICLLVFKKKEAVDEVGWPAFS